MKYLTTILVLTFASVSMAQPRQGNWTSEFNQWKNTDVLANHNAGARLLLEATTRAQLDAVHAVVDAAEQAVIDDPETPLGVTSIYLERAYASCVARMDGVAAGEAVLETELAEYAAAVTGRDEYIASVRLAFAWETADLRDNPARWLADTVQTLVLDAAPGHCPVPAHVVEAVARIEDKAVAFDALLACCKAYQDRAHWITEGKAVRPLVGLALNNPELDIKRVTDALSAAKAESWITALQYREDGYDDAADQVERAVNYIASVLAGLE